MKVSDHNQGILNLPISSKIHILSLPLLHHLNQKDFQINFLLLHHQAEVQLFLQVFFSSSSSNNNNCSNSNNCSNINSCSNRNKCSNRNYNNSNKILTQSLTEIAQLLHLLLEWDSSQLHKLPCCKTKLIRCEQRRMKLGVFP